MRHLILLLVLLPAMGFTACDRRPNVPETVTVVVERFKPLPAWAKTPLPHPVAANGTVEARLTNEDARGGVIDVANCHRRLLVKLDLGEAVDQRECER